MNEAGMENPADESIGEVLRLEFDRRLMLQFLGSEVTSGGELHAYSILGHYVGLTVRDLFA
jgi:hypothetical protein